MAAQPCEGGCLLVHSSTSEELTETSSNGVDEGTMRSPGRLNEATARSRQGANAGRGCNGEVPGLAAFGAQGKASARRCAYAHLVLRA